jgi:hypothetical protein
VIVTLIVELSTEFPMTMSVPDVPTVKSAMTIWVDPPRYCHWQVLSVNELEVPVGPDGDDSEVPALVQYQRFELAVTIRPTA